MPSESIVEPERRLPVKDEVDVLVAGGGSAGFASAVAAARCGARVLLVENTGCLGGLATVGLQNRLGPYHDQRQIVVGGIAMEMLERMIAMGCAAEPVVCPRSDAERYWLAYDPEAMKIVLDRMAEDSGVRVLFGVRAAGVVMDGRGVKGLIVEGKSGRYALLGRVVIDATGDGDVAALAGAECEKGRPADGFVQPMGLRYRVHHVDRERAREFLSARRGRVIREALQRGEEVPRRIDAGTDNILHADETWFNADHAWDVDATDDVAMSLAYLQARREIWNTVDFARRNVPGYESAWLGGSASLMGVRESRRVVGDVVLTAQDVLNARDFADGIARYACYVDIHPLTPDGGDRGPHVGQAPEAGRSYGIPFGSLLPRGIDNLLVAGRCFSATHEALASARMIPCCMAMGQAAGTAAALAAHTRTPPRAIDTALLRSRLTQQGAVI